MTALLGTFGEKFETFFPKVKKWFELNFLQNLFPQKFLPYTFRRKSEIFSLKIRKCRIHFLHNFFFGKMLVWTSRMQFWWYLRFFSPETWKSSAQVHKLLEKKDFNLKVFSFENLLWTHRVQFWLTFRIFWPEARKSLAQSQKPMEKTSSGGKVFLLYISLKP